MRSPAFWAVVAFVAGIVIADQVALSTYLLLALLVLLIILCLILLKHSGWLLTGLLLLTLFMAGFLRYEMATSDFPWNHVSNLTYLNSSVILRGQIVEDPDIRSDRTYLTVKVDSLTYQLKKIEVQGKILIKIKEPSNRFDYGDEIIVYGYLFSPLGKRNPGAFDYQRYLNTKGIYGQMNADHATEVTILSKGGNFILSKIIAPARKYVLQHFHQSLPAPYDNFLAGFVLGEKRGMPEELRQKFVRTGTLHLMAVSGSNVGLILLFAYFISALLRLPRWLKFGFLALVIVFFALLTNLQPSVVRASVMALLALIAFYTEREINFLNLISFTALLILFFNPQALYDVSFQLSFASVVAIGILLPQMRKIYHRVIESTPRFIYRWLIIPFFVSTAAILGTAPLNVYYFDNFAPIGFLSNLVIVPLVGMVVILGSLSSIMSLILPFVANLIIAANWLLLKITLGGVDLFGSFSFSLVKVPHPPAWVFWLYPVALLLLFFSFQSKRARAGLGLAVLLTGALITYNKVRADREITRITVLDVSPATVILFEPRHQKILYLHDSRPPQFDYLERTVIPFLYKRGISALDALVLLDSTDDYRTKLNRLKVNLSIKQVFISASKESSSPPINLPITQVSDQAIDLEGLKLWWVFPDNRKEPLGAIVEMKGLTWLEIDQPGFFESHTGKYNQPVIGCLHYEMFKGNGLKPSLNLQVDGIIINGWDFRSNKPVERNLRSAFPIREFYWTRKTGAIEVEIEKGKIKFYPTLED